MAKRSDNFDLISEGTFPWIFTFSWVANKPRVMFRNITDNTKLTAPDDAVEMGKIFPFDEWPIFCRSLIPTQKESEQERLF